MGRKPKTEGNDRPTEAELELLQALWKSGPSTVRALHDALGERKGVGYTTTLKTLQNMADKGLVKRSKPGRSHVYAARRKPASTQRQLVRDLLDRAFDGSPGQLVIQALSEKRASKEELEAIRTLLDKLDTDRRKRK